MRVLFFHKVLSLSLAAMVIFSSIGLNMHTHYCSMMSSMTSSWGLSSDSDSSKSEPNCCEDAASAATSCELPTETDLTTVSFNSSEAPCCVNAHYYIKAMIDIVLPQFDSKQLINDLFVLSANLTDIFIPAVIDKDLSPVIIVQELPPKTGQELVIAFNQLKIACLIL